MNLVKRKGFYIEHYTPIFLLEMDFFQEGSLYGDIAIVYHLEFLMESVSDDAIVVDRDKSRVKIDRRNVIGQMFDSIII